MTIIYRKDLPKGPVPIMRTDTPYKTPSIYRESGQYISQTFWSPKGFISAKLEINLVWFNRLGWYHSLVFESHVDVYTDKKVAKPKDRRVCEIDNGTWPSPTWMEGFMLPYCAESADRDAKRLIEARGLVVPNLSPYITKKACDRSYEDGTYTKYFLPREEE